MLTRIYIDNFRCFVNFEYRPARKQLIFGSNGSGKSSLIEVFLLLRRIAVVGEPLDFYPILTSRTRWLSQPQQRFEIEAFIDGKSYVYRLVLDAWGEPLKAGVVSETLHCGAMPLFEFNTGEVRLYDDRFEAPVTYLLDWKRSALATLSSRAEDEPIAKFKSWFTNLFCFRINPFGMSADAERDDSYPAFTLSNLAAWYRHLVLADPRRNANMLESLRESLEGFSYLKLMKAGEEVRTLAAEFTEVGKLSSTFLLTELSDGQRCLISLYMILHFVIAKGGTVILDEPDNFVALREIQPWLIAVTDSIEDGRGQILVISHHPEIINQWAPSGVQFVRDDNGPVRVEPFRPDPSTALPPAELVARGWERD